MTVLVSDSFNRANSTTTLGTTDSYNGGTAQAWSFYNGGVWGISNNEAYTPTVHIDNTAYVTTQADNATISLTIANSNVYVNGIAFRIQDATHFFRAYASGSTLKIDRNSGGTWTNIGSATGSFTYPLAISITLSGSTITYNVGGVAKFSVTDTNYQTASAHGLYINNASGILLDNFEIDSLSTGTNATISSVITNAAASTFAPTVAAQQQVAVSGVVANTNASGLAPSVSNSSSVSANISGVTASAIANAVTPVISTSGNVSVSSVVANASASGLAPSFSSSGNVSITSAISASIANALIPAISTGNTITSVVGSATSAGLAPQVGSFTNVLINAVASKVTASANSPALSAISNTSLNAPVSNTTAMAYVPNVGSGSSVTIPAVLASLVASMADPSVSTTKNTLINPPTAGVTVNATKPTIQIDFIFSAIVAGAQATGISPSLVMNANIIVSKVYLKGSRELSVTLQGSRQLNVTLRGSV